MMAAQAVAGAVLGGDPWRQPLWSLGGLFVAVIIIHPGNTGFSLLPLALILIGVPGYLLLLSAAAIGRKVGDRLLD
jgi:hypothetical protein